MELWDCADHTNSAQVARTHNPINLTCDLGWLLARPGKTGIQILNLWFLAKDPNPLTKTSFNVSASKKRDDGGSVFFFLKLKPKFGKATFWRSTFQNPLFQRGQ